MGSGLRVEVSPRPSILKVGSRLAETTLGWWIVGAWVFLIAEILNLLYWWVTAAGGPAGFPAEAQGFLALLYGVGPGAGLIRPWLHANLLVVAALWLAGRSSSRRLVALGTAVVLLTCSVSWWRLGRTAQSLAPGSVTLLDATGFRSAPDRTQRLPPGEPLR